MDNGKLIYFVQNYPHLYDKKRPDFKDAIKKQNSWIEISKLLKCSVEDAMNRWKCLREKYVRSAKKFSTGESTLTPEQDWEFYDSLKWLDPHISRRTRVKSSWPNDQTDVIETFKTEHDELLTENGYSEEDVTQDTTPVVTKFLFDENETINDMERLSTPDETPPRSFASTKTAKQDSSKIISEMESISSTIKAMAEIVSKRKADEYLCKEDLFGKQVAGFLKDCKNVEKKKKFMKTVFNMMIDDNDYFS